ncbi:MAG: N-acetylmuramoyl-L-alanine amidase [Prevotella sp.]|nr:N-acetylmuramoyl-L-alanine amidase [Candidatus Equicola stercoris]
MKKTILFFGVCLVAFYSFAATTPFTLVIDAGHGGHDPGAIGEYSQEKNINLTVALTFGRLVDQNCPGVKVVYTRTTDEFVELNERANIANRNKANLFISIHTNSVPKGRLAEGFETYTLGMARAAENLNVAKRENAVITYEQGYEEKYEGFNPNSAESYIMFEFMQDKNMAQSVELAKGIQRNVIHTADRIDKGVHQAGFLVLRKTSMPSCLVELGFISTPDEEQYLNSDIGISQLAHGLFNAFVEYRNKYDKHIVTPYIAPKAATQMSVPTVAPQKETQKENTAKKTAPTVTPQKETQKENITKKTEPTVTPQKETQKENTTKKKTLAELFPTSGKYYAVQIFASKRQLNSGDAQLQGEEAVYYQDGEWLKYITGISENISEASTLCKKLRSKFPEAFVITVKDGKRQ